MDLPHPEYGPEPLSIYPRLLSMFTRYSKDGGGFVDQPSGVVAVTADTGVYRTRVFAFRKPPSIAQKAVYWKSVTVTGELRLFVTNDPLSMVVAGTARWVLVNTSVLSALGGTGIVFTTGVGAIAANNETVFTLTGNGASFTAGYWQYSNTGSLAGSIELLMQD